MELFSCTFDFNQHLDQSVDSIRWLPGMGDYQQGQVKNIRTAAEANMIRAAIEGRLNMHDPVKNGTPLLFLVFLGCFFVRFGHSTSLLPASTNSSFFRTFTGPCVRMCPLPSYR